MARPAVGFRLFPLEAMAPLKEDLGLAFKTMLDRYGGVVATVGCVAAGLADEGWASRGTCCRALAFLYYPYLPIN